MGARELMFKSMGGYPMATKASGTLFLIIEKQHASWDLMCSTLPALELRFRRQPHIASARLLVARLGQITKWWFVHVES